MQIDIMFIALADAILFLIRRNSRIPTIVFLVFPMIVIMCMVSDCRLTTISIICLIITDAIGLICIEMDKKDKDQGA